MTVARNAETENAPAIFESRQNGWRSLWKNDGTDYPALLKSFLAGEITGEEIKSPLGHSAGIHHVEALGRHFLFKHVYNPRPNTEKRLMQRLGGTFDSKILKLTDRAIRNGCQNVQDMYLVSERPEGPYAKELWLIAEYVPGETLTRREAMARRGQIIRALASIHRHGLASHDFCLGNMILTPDEEIKLIDVSIHTQVTICQIKDVIRLERLFGDSPPFRELLLPGFGRRLLYHIIKARSKFRKFERYLLGKRDKDGRKIVKAGSAK